MTVVNIPKPLKLNNKRISYPYINRKNSIDPVYRLLVDIEDIEEEEKSDSLTNLLTVSLKYAYCQFSQYEQYLNENNFKSLNNEILNYYDKIIKSVIIKKYKVGQFGYILLSDSLEQSFVIIENFTKCDKEIFLLYRHYDITSPTPKVKISSGWISESLFTSINGTVDDATNDATKHLIQLLNWKICREDYLLKKVMKMRRINNNNNYELSLSDYISNTDENETDIAYTTTATTDDEK